MRRTPQPPTKRLRSGLFALAALAVWGGALPACQDDERSFKSQGNTEAKPVATLLNTLEPTSPLGGAGGGGPAKEAASLTYIIRVKTKSEVDLCSGEAQLKIMTDFNLQVPETKIQCQSLQIDLGSLFGGGKGLLGGQDSNAAVAAGAGAAAGAAAPASNITSILSHDGKVFYLSQLMGATFTPPRPMLLGPIVQDPEKYKDFVQSSDHTVTGIDPLTKQAASGKGSFHIKVLETQGFYKNNYTKDAFEHVLHWQIDATGFDGFPPSLGLTVAHIEWWWNTVPIMIPQIVITGFLKNFISDRNGTTDALVGEVTLSLIVKDYKIAE